MAEGVAGTQPDAAIDTLDGLVRLPYEGMNRAEDAMGVCEVGTRVDGPADRRGRLRVAQPRDGDEPMGEMCPGLSRVEGDGAIRALRGLGVGCLAVLPALKSAPDQADRAQAVRLRIAGFYLDSAVTVSSAIPSAR